MTPLADDSLNALMQLGFTQYEARAYCALLGQPPMNGHEAAKAAGIPPSKIYETLNRLVEKGAVRVERSDPVTYAASPKTEILEAARRKFQRAFDLAESALSHVPSRIGPGQIWSLQDRDAVLAACASMIETTKLRLSAALWDEELTVLQAPLEAASRRGCAVDVAVFGATPLIGPRSYDLRLCGRSVFERLGGRRLSAIVADGSRATIAEFKPGGMVEAVTTDNPVISLLAEEYIKADVLGRILINDLGQARFDERLEPDGIDGFLRS